MIFSCKNASKPYLYPSDSALDSSGIVNKFCGACHLVPGAELADKATWRSHILPNMGCRLGVKTQDYDPMKNFDMMNQLLVSQSNIYPSHPLLSDNDWNKIKDYIVERAPDSLRVEPMRIVPMSQFSIIPFGRLVDQPRITLLHYDEDQGFIKVGQESGRLITLDRHWHRIDSLDVGSTPIDYHRDSQHEYVLSVGRMYPSEQKLGSLIELRQHSLVTLIRDLHRPVSLQVHDMNGDGLNDAIISEFGYETGALTWYDLNMEGTRSRPNILSLKPGAVKTLSADMDGDGRADVVSLMAQGDELVFVFRMGPSGSGAPLQVLRFPPIHGACDLDLIDFDQDRRMDIVISNGDNADYSPINKPYHGISVYLNKGDLNFKKEFFIPYPGVLHSIISDFDQDGDMDIISVSFFPGSIDHPVPPCVYFEQVNGSFIAHSFDESYFGKWMTITSGDFDQDGDEDLLMGSFLLNDHLLKGSRAQWQEYSLMLLRNNLK